MNNKSINQIKYQVSYSDDSGIIQIKHQNSTSKTSFYIRESYNFNKSTQRNEIVYEQVYRKVKTYFDFSKLTSVGPILGFVSNDTQFCNDNYSVSSTISFTNNFRRMNMLRYISTAYGMEYTIGIHIDSDGNEVNRPSDDYEKSRSDNNSNHVEAQIETYVNQSVSEIINEDDSSKNNNLSASEMIEKRLKEYNKEESKKITVMSKDNTFWSRDVSGNWSGPHKVIPNKINNSDEDNDVGRLL